MLGLIGRASTLDSANASEKRPPHRVIDDANDKCPNKKEDFDKFADSLKEIIEFIREANPQPIDPDEPQSAETSNAKVIAEESNVEETKVEEEKDFTNVEFEDLGEETT